MSKDKKDYLSNFVRVESVVSLFRRTKIVFASILFIGVSILLFLIYIPFSDVLEESLLTNFEQVAIANYNVLDGSVKRSVEGAKGLSSRTMIKNAAEEFQKELISFEELTGYTQPKYEDGAKTLEHLALAERFIGDRLVASYRTNDKLLDFNIPEQFFKEEGNSFSMLYLSNEYILFLYRSPVFGQDGEVAYDILIFDITAIVEKLCTTTINTQVLDENTYQNLIGSEQLIKTDGEIKIFSTKDMFLVSVSFLDNTFFITQKSRIHLLEPVYRLRNMIFWVSFSLLIGFITVIYFYLIKYAKKELLSLESRQCVLKKMAEKANYDILTSAGNRSSGDQCLKLAFQKFKSERISLAVMMIDVDNLKRINDTYGHDIGDVVLRSVVSTIYQKIKKEHKLFRWGGDEFIAAFSGTTQSEAMNLAKIILAAISEMRIETEVDGQFVTPTISIGLTGFHPNDTQYEDAIKRADRALYQSKMKGKNQVNALWKN